MLYWESRKSRRIRKYIEEQDKKLLESYEKRSEDWKAMCEDLSKKYTDLLVKINEEPTLWFKVYGEKEKAPIIE